MNKFDECLEWLTDGFIDAQTGHTETNQRMRRALLEALTQAAEIERGDKVVVDREPTDAMLRVGQNPYGDNPSRIDRHDIEFAYKAMIAASEGE